MKLEAMYLSNKQKKYILRLDAKQKNLLVEEPQLNVI